MSQETIKNSTKPKKVVHVDTTKEPLVQSIKRRRTKSTKPRDSVVSFGDFMQNLEIWYFSYEAFFGFRRNSKRFRSEGSFGVSR